jgi:hypothetical protein
MTLTDPNKVSRWDLVNLPIRGEMRIRIVREVAPNVGVINVELLSREGDQRSEISGPPYPLALGKIENVPDGHIIAGQKQFALSRLPYRQSPIADDAMKGVGAPAIEGGCHYGNVGVIRRQFGIQLVN